LQTHRQRRRAKAKLCYSSDKLFVPAASASESVSVSEWRTTMCVPPLAIEIEILDALRRVIKQGPKNKQTDLVIFGKKRANVFEKSF